MINFLSGDLRSAVATAKKVAGDKNVVVIGANVGRQSIEAELVDEIIVSVAPILLGDGLRFFEQTGRERINLEKTTVIEAGPITNLRFTVTGRRG